MGINSKYGHISNHTQLMYTIMQLNASRVEQEEEVKHKLKEVYYSFQPVTLLKNVFRNNTHGPEIKKNLSQSALSLGTSFLISKVLKRGVSVKGYLLSLAMEKVADYALSGKSEFITNGVEKVNSLIKKFRSGSVG